jgi:hypothetical protein
MIGDEFKKVPIEQIPKGMQFKAALHIQRSKVEVKEANDWWKHLSDDAKCLIYWGYVDAEAKRKIKIKK